MLGFEKLFLTLKKARWPKEKMERGCEIGCNRNESQMMEEEDLGQRRMEEDQILHGP